MAVLCGIGFTMSLFIGSLAWNHSDFDPHRLGVLGGSLASAVLGYVPLRAASQAVAPERVAPVTAEGERWADYQPQAPSAPGSPAHDVVAAVHVQGLAGDDLREVAGEHRRRNADLIRRLPACALARVALFCPAIRRSDQFRRRRASAPDPER